MKSRAWSGCATWRPGHPVDPAASDRPRVDASSRSRSFRSRLSRKTKADQDRLGGALRKLTGEDPSASVSIRTRRPARPSSGGWASCTWRSSSTACMREFRVAPMSAGRRWPTGKRSGDGYGRRRHFIRQVGGRGTTVTWIRIWHPSRRRAECEFCRRGHGGGRSAGVYPAGEAGCARRAGAAACWPGTRWWTFGSPWWTGRVHEVDSSELGLQGGWHAALQDARARPPGAAGADDGAGGGVPEEFMGDVIGDLNPAPRPGHKMEARRWCRSSPRCTTGGDVRLRDRPALDDAGSARTIRCSFTTTNEVPRAHAEEISPGRGD